MVEAALQHVGVDGGVRGGALHQRRAGRRLLLRQRRRDRPAIGGCAVPGPDGSCTAQVKSWLLAYPDALRAALEHEVGHCLGLPHNTSDKRSIMSPNLSLMSPPAGPDNTDLGNLRDVTW